MKKSILLIVVILCSVFTISANPASSDVAKKVLLENLLKDGDSFIGQKVDVSGMVSHICAHTGMKLFFKVPNSKQTFRVNSTKELGKFSRLCNNHNVQIIGTVVEMRIDNLYLDNWEKELIKSNAEGEGDGETGCQAEKTSFAEKNQSGVARIKAFRTRIEARKKMNGKNYLSFYTITAESYKILK